MMRRSSLTVTRCWLSGDIARHVTGPANKYNVISMNMEKKRRKISSFSVGYAETYIEFQGIIVAFGEKSNADYIR